MPMSLNLFYRGHVSDCNYSCHYCPFALTRNSAEQRQLDQRDLARFVDWVEHNSSADRPMSILITPYGEALIHPWYRDAVIRLSHLPFVNKIAIQTNLSCHLDWLQACNKPTTALWATYHPEQVRQDKFVNKCATLNRMGIHYSVGVVGMQQHFEQIASLRQRLPKTQYLWINAYKRQADYYSSSDIEFLQAIDPLFKDNLPDYPSLGRSCQAGQGAVLIEGNGDLYRCHFIKTKRGNIFEQPLDSMLRAEACSKTSCHCYIGYIHLDELQLAQKYGERLLERIPIAWHQPSNEL
jgi:MoaA/NifB/PqqE/SkfB family radical SAM enzyme